MRIDLHSITIRATIVPDDVNNAEQFQKTFTAADLPKAPGVIADIFSLAKRYVFHHGVQTAQQSISSPPLTGEGEGEVVHEP